MKELELIEDLGMLYPNEKSKQKRKYGIFKCHCGVEFKSQQYQVKSGKTKSCGCYAINIPRQRENFTKKVKHRLYDVWNCMMQRCNNDKNTNFMNYGGRGIYVCKDWYTFENFLNDMEHTFEDGLKLDRVDNNSGYSKNNCRWTTQAVQCRNTRVIHSDNTSGYRGVHFEKSRSKFQSYISVDKKKIHLGRFKTALDAAKAYDKYVFDNNLEHSINGVL